MSTYGREALRLLRESQQQARTGPQEPHKDWPSVLDGIPPDAPMDDATLTVWNGKRFVAYERWLATAPVVREEKWPDQSMPFLLANTTCVTGECGGRRVCLVKDGERWLMYVGSRKAGGRRRDFASPFPGHAIRTAEQWYGVAGSGWRAEQNGNEGGAAAQ
jgi:hypothetical protein